MLLKKAVSTLLLSAACVSLAQAQVTVGVITSAAGPLAMIGVPQKNTVALLPTQVGDQAIRYIALDDGSDPTATVKALKKLISEDNVDAIIGPSGSPNAIGVISFVAEAQVPLLSPVGTAAVILPMTAEKKWVFMTTQNDELIAKALFEHMAKKGVKTLGFIGTADPYGENWAKVMAGLAAQQSIKVVANERFQRQDTSVTGQSLKILGARPDAVLAVFNCGQEVPLHLPDTAAGWELILDTTRPALTVAVSPATVPAGSVLLMRAVAGVKGEEA